MVFNRHIGNIAVGLAALAVFFGSLSLLSTDRVFVSPDENANYFFSQTFANTGSLSAYEPLGADLDDAVRPRSIVSRGGSLMPVSFVGLPVVYGAIAKVFGMGLVPLLTPLLFALSIFAFRALMNRLFDKDTAFVATILYAFHPAMWYYAARALMHNVPFTALLVFAAYVAVCRPLAQKFTRGRLAMFGDAGLAGLLVGCAIFFRTSEIVWILLALLTAFLVTRVRLTSRQVLMFGVGIIVGLIPMLIFNAATYGTPFTYGYTVTPLLTTSVEPAVVNEVREEKIAVFPFGLHPRAALVHLSEYGLGLFWWLTILAAAGLIVLFQAEDASPEQKKLRKAYGAFFAVAAGYLALMYGSWTIRDNPDPTAITIGNSYVRYWLPAYVLSVPLAAFCIMWLSRRLLRPMHRRLLASALTLACIGLSVATVFYTRGDGLVDARATLRENADIRGQLLNLTETDSIIIADRGDKFLFPYRRVVTPLRNEHTYALMPRILLRVPLYYYGVTFPETDLRYLNEEKLPPLGLRIEEMRTFGAESLYRIYRIPS